MDLTNLFFALYKTVEDCVAPLLLGPVINIAPRRSKVSLALIGFSFTATTQQAPLGWGPPPPRPLALAERCPCWWWPDQVSGYPNGDGFNFFFWRVHFYFLASCLFCLLLPSCVFQLPPFKAVCSYSGLLGECAPYRVLWRGGNRNKREMFTFDCRTCGPQIVSAAELQSSPMIS